MLDGSLVSVRRLCRRSGRPCPVGRPQQSLTLEVVADVVSVEARQGLDHALPFGSTPDILSSAAPDLSQLVASVDAVCACGGASAVFVDVQQGLG